MKMLPLEDLKLLKPKEIAEYVNRHVNAKLRFVNDHEDYWQTPKETIQLKKGDCEDYAILKMYYLSKLGFTKEQLRLVYCNLMTGRIKEAHIVLEVDIKGKPYYLDNTVTEMYPVKKRTDIEPIFQLNESMLWVKGNKVKDCPKERISKWRDMLERMEKQKDYFF